MTILALIDSGTLTIDWSSLNTWQQIWVAIVIFLLVNFVIDVPLALRGIQRELKRRNDRDKP